MVLNILGQIFGVMAWFFLLYSYYKKQVKHIILIQIISCIFYLLSYLLLNAYAGFAVCLFETIKIYLYYRLNKYADTVFMFSLPIYALITYLTCHNYFDVLSILASIASAATVYKKRFISVLGGTVSSVLWVLYDIYIQNYACALTDATIIISNVIIMYNIRKDKPNKLITVNR